MNVIRQDCRWHLMYGGNSYCRREAFVSPKAPLRKLDLGCDCDESKDYQRQQWKADLYGDPGQPPRTEVRGLKE